MDLLFPGNSDSGTTKALLPGLPFDSGVSLLMTSHFLQWFNNDNTIPYFGKSITFSVPFSAVLLFPRISAFGSLHAATNLLIKM